ncbi:MAG: hypothetical protein QM658_01320 [Gordonia sp. (in: high G+C Gram-positive bacteria)]
MTNYDPRDPRYRQNPPTQAYSQSHRYPEYADEQDYGYSKPGYQDPGYTQAQPAYQPQQPRRAPRREPDIDPLLFSGGVLMTGVVTGLAAWLTAWIIRTIADRATAEGLGVWNPLDQDELWFALAGFLTALVGGALWYVLQLTTPTPGQFYRWIVLLLIVAAVIVPLTASSELHIGIATAIIHLVIGLPVLTLIPTMGSHSQRRR